MLVKATKTVDKMQATVGDILTYTIQCLNTGSVAANQIQIVDTIPSGTIYLAGSTSASVPFTGDPTTSIQLTNPLLGGQSASVSFKVRVTFGSVTSTSEGPAQNPILNQASVSYQYVPVTGQAPIRETVTTNTVSTQVNWAELAPITKQVDKATVNVGEELLYTLSFKNEGNIQADQVSILDPVPMGTSYVEGTVVSNVSVTGSPLTTMQLTSPVAPGQSVILSFSVKVKEVPASGMVVNQGGVHYRYTVGGTTVEEIEPSNPVATKVNPRAFLQIFKASDRLKGIEGDVITYALDVTNRGNVDALNVNIVDPLEQGTLYNQHLTINGIPSSEDITKGLIIPSIPKGGTVKIAFQALIISVPEGGTTFENKAYGTYQYQVDGQGATAQVESNQTMVTAYKPMITLKKEVTDQTIQVGETFMYKATISNQGPLAAQSVWIQDILPTQLQVMEIKVNGQVVSGNLATGIVIGGLAIGAQTEVAIQVKAVGSLAQPFINTIKAKLMYQVDSNMPSSEQQIVATAPPIWVAQGWLDVIKTADKQEYIVGENVKYTLTLKNTGNLLLQNVMVTDILRSELSFITGSVWINGMPQVQEDVLNGIRIPEVKVGEQVVITFSAKIEKEGNIPNLANASYHYQMTPQTLPQEGANESNVVVIHANRVALDVTKQSDVAFASLRDSITYTIKVKNTTQVEVVNILLKDKVSSNVELVPGTFKVDGEVVQNMDLDKGINIGKLTPGSMRTITYQVKIISGNCAGEIINGVWLRYQYILPDDTIGDYHLPPTEQAIATVEMGISNFKQLSVESYLSIPEAKPDVEAINLATGTISIKSCHVIETPTGSSMEHQHLTGYKLVVHGILELVIEYTALDQVQSVHSAHYTIPFSTFIVLPQNYYLGSKMEVEGRVEDIYYQSTDIRTFFQNTTALINVKILGCDMH